MDPRLIRFKGSPTTLRGYFVNDFLVKNLGKTKAQIEAAMKTWPERIDHPKHGRKTLAELLSTPGQDLKRFLNWTTGRDPGDFTFFSWNESGQLIFGPVNCETCLLVDRLIQLGLPMGKKGKLKTIVGEWHTGEYLLPPEKRGSGGCKKLCELLLCELQKLAVPPSRPARNSPLLPGLLPSF